VMKRLNQNIIRIGCTSLTLKVGYRVGDTVGDKDGDRVGNKVLCVKRSTDDVSGYIHQKVRLQQFKFTYGSGNVGERVGYSVGDWVLQAKTISILLNLSSKNDDVRKSSITYGSGAVGDNVGCVKTRKYLKGELVL